MKLKWLCMTILLLWVTKSFSKELVIDGKSFSLPDIPYSLEKVLYFDEGDLRHRVLLFNNLRTEGGHSLRYEKLKLPNDGGFSYVIEAKELAAFHNQQMRSEAPDKNSEAGIFCCQVGNLVLDKAVISYEMKLKNIWKCRFHMSKSDSKVSCSKG